MKTPCNNLVCAECISSLVLDVKSSLPFPYCKDCHELSPTMFVPASDVVLKVLGALLVRCDKTTCTAVLSLQHLAEHIKSGCKVHTVSSLSPPKLTMKQILSRPLESPPTVVEQKAAANIVKRLLHTSPSAQQSSSSECPPTPVVKLATDGTVSTLITKMHKKHIMLSFNKPLSLVRVSTPRVSSSNASRWTMTRRSSSISAVRSSISGGASTDQLYTT